MRGVEKFLSCSLYREREIELTWYEKAVFQLTRSEHLRRLNGRDRENDLQHWTRPQTNYNNWIASQTDFVEVSDKEIRQSTILEDGDIFGAIWESWIVTCSNSENPLGPLSRPIGKPVALWLLCTLVFGYPYIISSHFGRFSSSASTWRLLGQRISRSRSDFDSGFICCSISRVLIRIICDIFMMSRPNLRTNPKVLGIMSDRQLAGKMWP
jgi:hypothetical protein